MPTYSYHCDACDSEWEQEQRISESAIKKCPKCGKLKARRMITNGNFILKGGGWYSDGYGAGSKSSKSSSSTKDEAKSSSGSSESKDSKDSKASASGGSEKSAAAS